MIPQGARPLPRGTFLAIITFGFLVLGGNLAAIGAIIYITTQGRTPTAILGALAMAGFDRLIILADRVFVWTRDGADPIEETP